MKARVLIVAIVAALTVGLGAPAGAGADLFGFAGNVKGGGKISFQVRTSNHGNVVRRLKFKDVTATCEGASGQLSVNIFGSAPIDSHREFHVVGEGGGSHSRVAGRFRASGARANGTVRLYGMFNDGQGGQVRCNTGLVEWGAKLT